MKTQLMDNLYGKAIGEVMDLISSLNILVVKCVKEIFNKERFKNCIGGFFFLCLLAGKLVCIIKFLIDGLYSIRKYIFSLSNSFNKYIKKNPNLNSPPNKKKKNKIKKKKYSKNENNLISSIQLIKNLNPQKNI